MHRSFLCLALTASVFPTTLAQSPRPRPAAPAKGANALQAGFLHPPDSAKPRVWWHWMGGNVTQAGITADLEWMRSANIGGMQMFDGEMGTPLFLDHPVIWMTPEWKADWRHAAAEADRLHLEMAMAASGGFSETAGPWVKPEQSMKKYVWSATTVTGPSHFSAALTHPPSNDGKFQDMPQVLGLTLSTPVGLPGAKPRPPAPPEEPTPTYYADTFVVAYRIPGSQAAMDSLRPTVTSSAGSIRSIDGSALMDGSWNKTVSLSFPKGQPSGWIQFEYPRPFLARAISIGVRAGPSFSGIGLPQGEVEASEDGRTWRTLLEIPGPGESLSVNLPIRTWSLPETTAKYYRVVIDAPKPSPMLAMLGMSPANSVELSEIQLHSGPRVNYWEDKASFGIAPGAASQETPAVSSDAAIHPADVIDLTSKMRPDGSLDWDVPAGNWTILRFGYALTGEKNHPATREATGLEVDKLSHADVLSYVQQYTKMISDTAGPYFGKSFRYFLMDSWEAGQENWTENMAAEFRKRRGYDMTPYLPALTGRVVESAAVSDAFLWDFRRTIADLLAENDYGLATQYFAQHGIGLEAEAMGTALPTTGDGLLNKGQVTIPMGEFWTPLPGQPDTPEHPADVREAASASHIYGKPLAATESFTTMPFVTPWGQSPFYLKPLVDQAFAAGINRIVYHTADEQPFTGDAHKPGMTLGFFGQDYGRNITWAKQAVAWDTYIARASYLLQQGKYVADVAYFCGEGAPVTVPFWKPIQPAAPLHYGYDYVDADVLLHGATVHDGRLVLASGMSYRLLVVPDDEREMSLPLLRNLHQLVSAGMVLLSPKPLASPSLSDGLNSAAETRTIAGEMWGSEDEARAGRSVGQGKVFTGMPIEDVLAALQLAPDVTYDAPENAGLPVNYPLPKGNSEEPLVWIHRRTQDADIYFLSTQLPHAFDIRVHFRMTGRAAELWRPGTGRSEPASYSIVGGQTTVPLHMEAEGSVFVIFRGHGSPDGRAIPALKIRSLATIDGPWQLTFPPNWGAPPQIRLASLESWTASSDPGVKYFSGTATYSKTLTAPKEWFQQGRKIMLDLGAVREIAEVRVNGVPAGGILWKVPYQADVTRQMHPGVNHIEVSVTNLWPNRMIGDLQPGVTRTYTFTDFYPFKKDSPLLESGLLGPVRVLAGRRH